MAPWFRRKRVGIGYAPATWQGWTLTVVTIVAIGVLPRLLRPSQGRPPALLYGVEALIVAAFVGLAAWTSRSDQSR